MKTNRLDIFTSFIFLMILFFMGGFNFPNEGESQRKEEYVKFRIKNMGFNVDGEFSNFTKSVSYNKQNPEFSMFKGTISGASINTGIKKRDEHLRGEEYFHIEKFGQIAFESTSVKKTGANEMKITGLITIKGVQKSIELMVTSKENGGKTSLLISGTLNRRDFGVGGYSLVLSDDVKLDLKIEV